VCDLNEFINRKSAASKWSNVNSEDILNERFLILNPVIFMLIVRKWVRCSIGG
jgi:hypothetical protein